MPRAALHATTRADHLDIEVEAIHDGVIVRPFGEIDINKAAAFRAHLIASQRAHPARIVIDLTHVPWIDSAVVAALVQTLRSARVGSTMLILCRLQPRVMSIMEIVGLAEEVFTIADTIEEAVSIPNRRQFERFGHENLECSRGVILDISAGGLKLRSKRKLHGIVRLTIKAEGVALHLRGRVVWSIRLRWRHHECGIQFTRLTAEDVQALAVILEAATEQSSRRKRDPRPD